MKEDSEERKAQVKRYFEAAKKGRGKKSPTNELTDFIIEAFKALPNCDAFRVNTTGIWDPKKKLFRKSHTTKGFSDIQITYKGVAVYVEVKSDVTKDRLSIDQQKFRFRVNKAGSLYFIAKNKDQFLKWFEDELARKRPFTMPEYLI